MYLVVRHKPHMLVQFARGEPPDAFEIGGDRYARLRRPLMTATWRVDDGGYPVAVFCRAAPGEQWPADVESLPRLERQGTALTFWLTTERCFAPHDILCDDVAFYQAGPLHFAWAFSMANVSAPTMAPAIVWPRPEF